MEIVWPIEYYSHVGVSNTTTNVYVGGPDWYSVEFICNFDARTIIASSGTELAFCRDNCYVRVLGSGSRRHKPRFKCTLLRACNIIENSLGKSYGMIPTFARRTNHVENICAVVQLLPQPIAEEIIPHLTLSIRTVLEREVY